MLIALYPSKKACKESVGKPFKYQENSLSVFTREYVSTGTITVAGEGREWFGQVTLDNDIITKVK